MRRRSLFLYFSFSETIKNKFKNKRTGKGKKMLFLFFCNGNVVLNCKDLNDVQVVVMVAQSSSYESKAREWEVDWAKNNISMTYEAGLFLFINKTQNKFFPLGTLVGVESSGP
jgi:hypothetical protein